MTGVPTHAGVADAFCGPDDEMASISPRRRWLSSATGITAAPGLAVASVHFDERLPHDGVSAQSRSISTMTFPSSTRRKKPARSTC